VDPGHGDYHAAYEKMGSPRYPTPSQIQQLVNSSALPPAEEETVKNGTLTLTLPSYGLALIEIQ
jgi:beta-xylosidase